MNLHYAPLSEELYSHIPEEFRPRLCVDSRGVMATDEEGVLQAAMIADSWSLNSCQIHIYIANPFVLKNGFAEEVFGFIFGDESGREIIIGVTPAGNHKALKFIEHMGFVEAYRIKDGFKKGEDYVMTLCHKADCKYISHEPKQLELEMNYG